MPPSRCCPRCGRQRQLVVGTIGPPAVGKSTIIGASLSSLSKLRLPAGEAATVLQLDSILDRVVADESNVACDGVDAWQVARRALVDAVRAGAAITTKTAGSGGVPAVLPQLLFVEDNFHLRAMRRELSWAVGGGHASRRDAGGAGASEAFCSRKLVWVNFVGPNTAQLVLRNHSRNEGLASSASRVVSDETVASMSSSMDSVAKLRPIVTVNTQSLDVNEAATHVSEFAEAELACLWSSACALDSQECDLPLTHNSGGENAGEAEHFVRGLVGERMRVASSASERKALGTQLSSLKKELVRAIRAGECTLEEARHQVMNL